MENTVLQHLTDNSSFLSQDLQQTCKPLNALFVGNDNADAQATPRLDPLDRAVHSQWLVERQLSREACADPEQLVNLNKHSLGADVTDTALQQG